MTDPLILSPELKLRRRAVLGSATALAMGSAPGLSFGQSELPPLQDFIRPADVSQLSLSPDGSAMFGVRQVNGRANLFVVDLKAGKSTVITNLRDGDVADPFWVSNKRIMFGVQDRQRGSGDQFNTGLFAIDKDAADFKELSERGFLSTDSRLLPVSTFPFAKGKGSSDDEYLVQIWSSQGSRVLRGCNIHRLNTRTGRSEIVTTGGPGRVQRWIPDQEGVFRVAVSSEEDGRVRLHYRPAANAAWEVIHEDQPLSPTRIEPLAFNEQGKLYVATRINTDFSSIYIMDPVTKRVDPEPLASLKGYDLEPTQPESGQPPPLSDPLILESDGRLRGIRYHAERRGTVWFNEARAKLQDALEATFPDRLVSVQGDLTKPERPLLVTVQSDVEAPRYFLYQQSERKMVPVGESRPWLKPERMSSMSVYRYAARDGLSIPATLTLPRGATGKNLPLVVLHYGGPNVRATAWGFDPLVQFLASRGYAVFMPAPRASTGFGWQHYKAGWKQWGLGMQDDVTDGVRDLINRGVADPKRICLAGASYGGYLTMMGLVKEPGLFKCGINWVGVTDPELMYVEWTDFAAGPARELSLPILLGHPRTDAEQFARTSPVKRAKEIKAPVLMAYGGSDRRVPIVNGERMRDALKDNGTEVEWVVYGDEGHNFMRLDTRLDFYGRMERFLARHMKA